MTLGQKQAVFSLNVAKLIQHIYATGYTLSLGECFRTEAQAELDVKNGTGILDSLHCKRLAIDLQLFKDGIYLTNPKEYDQFGIYWESLNPLNRNGRNFKRGDANHFEMQDL